MLILLARSRWLFIDEETEGLPVDLLKFLPFSQEPLSEWNEKTDLRQFLLRLHDKEATMVDESSGVRTKISYKSNADSVYSDSKEFYAEASKRFLKKALDSPPAPGAARDVVKVPDFPTSSAFGWVAKSCAAWDAIVSALMERAEYFSLAHLMESQSDLTCSLLLAEQLHYKQAMQVLRGFIEDLVYPIYFAARPDRFERWKTNEFRLPQMRAREGGLLSDLVTLGVLTEELSEEVSELYGQLNRYIHSGESTLTNSGLFEGKWMGDVYDEEKFHTWCGFSSHCIYVGLMLLRVSLAQREQSINNLGQGIVVCGTCGRPGTLGGEKLIFSGIELTRYTCPACNRITTFYERQPVFIVTHDPEGMSNADIRNASIASNKTNESLTDSDNSEDA